MRTQDEIVAKCIEVEKDTAPFGFFTSEVLIPYLDKEHVKPFLRKNELASWDEVHNHHKDEDDVLMNMREYIGFAWQKVYKHKGITAITAVAKLRAWVWLIGDDELYRWTGLEESCKNFGAPAFKRVSEKYGFEIPNLKEVQNMADGKKCRPDCDEGCENEIVCR
jgi:hypothetical protein